MKIITAVDLGSHKICTIIAIKHNNDKIEIKAFSSVLSEGIEAGVVKDLQKTANAIKKSITEAESKSKLRAENIFFSISGQHISCKNASGKVSIAHGPEPSEVDQSHIDAVINDARNSIKVKSNTVGKEILHCIPQSYNIDTQKDINNPIGMAGFSLEVNTLILMGESSHLRNIRRAITMAGIPESTIIVGAIATIESIINEDEQRMGCIVIDIGSGTSDILVYKNHNIYSYVCSPEGGELITKDLEVGLLTPNRSAERVKLEYGNAVVASVTVDLKIEVEGIGGRASQDKSLKLVSQIIQSRSMEMLDKCYKGILAEYVQLESLTAGVVLTGGTSLIRNIHYLAEDQNAFNLPARVAYTNLKGLHGATSDLENPAYSCAIGMIKYIANLHDLKEDSTQTFREIPSGIADFFKDMFKKIKEI
jgi:cell division protein FtsA